MRRSAIPLIEFWRNGGVPKAGRRVHSEDHFAISKKEMPQRLLVKTETLQGLTAFAEKHCCGYFHTDLNPVPYLGNLHAADIFLLMINPHAGEDDYKDDGNADLQKIIVELREQRSSMDLSCLAFQSRFQDTAWYKYYNKLTAVLIKHRAKDDRTEAQLRNELSRRVAVLELVPYYSANRSKITSEFLTELPSAKFMRVFAQELFAEAQAGAVTILTQWGQADDIWGLQATSSRTSPVVSLGGRSPFSLAAPAIWKQLGKPPSPR